MEILPVEAEGDFIRQGLPAQIGARRQQAFDHRRRCLGGFVAGQPIGIAATAGLSSHVIDILGRKSQSA